jgi:hypothetical protein
MKRVTAVITMICMWACLLPVTVSTTGCNQNTIAALVGTLGNAASAIAVVEGNTTLAAQLKTDTAAAVTAITNWKQGTPSQNALQTLNIVIDDLNLICPANDPTNICGPYGPLVALALGTAESIIAILAPSATTFGVHGDVQKTNLGYYPTNSKDFEKQWNAYCVTSPALAQLAIK